jgi:DNA mismatch endonuclease (patch repair protein)
VDVVDRATRSAIMSRIRGQNTAPELAVRSFLHVVGLRFRIHAKALPGTPDVVLPAARTVVFVNGCYWHQHPDRTCPHTGLPRSNRPFWRRKFRRNVARDEDRRRRLARMGWRVEVVWECEAKSVSRLRRLARVLTTRRARLALLAVVHHGGRGRGGL